jgi:hypothetical protein
LQKAEKKRGKGGKIRELEEVLDEELEEERGFSHKHGRRSGTRSESSGWGCPK